jgi:hypothetical protein
MTINTLGHAWKLGWRVRARCYWLGPNKSGRRKAVWCDTTVELDMVTLIWTRGENFPLELLAQRLRCPKCGRIDSVRVFFDVPNQPNARVAAE